jgi:hypothetical protein
VLDGGIGKGSKGRILQTSPREAKYYRALHRTYLDPAPSQDHPAELLDLLFSTYRRHLEGGITRVVEIPWHRDRQALEPNKFLK